MPVGQLWLQKPLFRFLVLLSGLLIPATAMSRPPIIALPQGKIAGLAREGVLEFRNLPFAAAPVGALRWQPPQAPKPWQGVRDGSKFAAACAQIDTLGAFAAPSDAEDCLYLNVTIPAPRSRGKLPVLFWIPGGAFWDGGAQDYDTSALARRGMVVVTINYRLGVLGFFSNAAIDGEGHPAANYGLMDQQAALRWVRNNIANFGGDPDNITISGESAGGSSVLHHFVSPSARGLFAKAVSLSGIIPRVTPLARARMLGDDFAAKMGCASGQAADDARCLRALPVKDILARQQPYLTAVIVDGTLIPAQPADLLKSGDYAHVPYITGVVQREGAFMLAIRELQGKPLSFDNLAGSFTGQRWKAHVDEVLRAYPPSQYPSASEAFINTSQGWSSCMLRRIAATTARHTPTYTYEFSGDAPSYFPKTRFRMGAFHTSELQYLFPQFHGGSGTPHPLDAQQREVSDEMLGYLANFVRTGDPNGAGLRPWPRYRPETDLVNALGSGTVLNDFGARYKCALWDRFLDE